MRVKLLASRFIRIAFVLLSFELTMFFRREKRNLGPLAWPRWKLYETRLATDAFRVPPSANRPEPSLYVPPGPSFLPPSPNVFFSPFRKPVEGYFSPSARDCLLRRRAARPARQFAYERTSKVQFGKRTMRARGVLAFIMRPGGRSLLQFIKTGFRGDGPLSPPCVRFECAYSAPFYVPVGIFY